MTAKKTDTKKVHDLRDEASVKVAVPDVSGEFVGVKPLPATDGPSIDSPSIGNEPPGQATHD